MMLKAENKTKTTVVMGILAMLLCGAMTQAATGEGLSNVFVINNRTGTGYRVAWVTPTYRGVFAQGVSLTNTISAEIDWHGKTPSHVVFWLNGQTKTVYTSTTTASTSFNMGQDLSYSLIGAKNELRVYAVAGDGSQTTVYTENFWGLSLPEWAKYGKLEAVPSTGMVNLKGDASFDAFKINAMGSIPDTVPAIGGQWGIRTDPLKFHWDLYAYPMGTSLGADFTLGGSWGGDLRGGKNARGSLSTSMTGSGGFNPEFNLYSIDAHLRATAGFDTPKARLPFCPVNPCPYFMASLDLGIEGNVSFEQGTPSLIAGLKFKQGTLGLDATVSGTVGSKAGKLWDVSGTIGGNPWITFQFPPDDDNNCLNRYIQSIGFKVIAKAEGKILWWNKDWEREYLIYNCPDTATMQFFALDDTGYVSGPKIMSRDYLYADEGYSVFPSLDEGMMQPMAVGGLPEPITNVGPTPFPSVAATNDNGLLVFVYDDENKPVGKHMEIYFARWHNDDWTTHALITDDFNVNTHPVAAIDDVGTELVVWMQAPEITGTEQGPEDIIGGFEIVWSKYDPISGTWQTAENLTENTYFDGLPWFDRSVAGQLRVCWIASPTNAVSVWDDDDIAPLVNLMAADWDGSSFGDPYMIAENLVTAAPPAIAQTDTHEIMAYLKDHDDNAATLDDIEVVVRTRTLGGQWDEEYYLTNDNMFAKMSVDVAVDAYGMPLVIWTTHTVPATLPDGEETTTDQVWFSAFVEDWNGGYMWTEPEMAFEYPGISEPTLYRNEAGKIVLYWTALSDDFWDMYYSVLDADYMTWSAAQQITFDQDAETMISVTESGGNILAAFVKRRIDLTDSEMPPQIGLSDIHLLEHIPSRDLSIAADDIRFSPAMSNDLAAFVEYWLDQDCDEPDWCGGFDLDQSGNVDLVDFMLFSNVFYSDVYPQPGRYTKVSADVYLAGDFTTHDILVHFYDGDPDDGGTLIGTDTIDVLFPGNKHTAQVLWLVPEDKVNIDVYVVVDPDNQIEEDNKANNVAFVRPLKADLAARSVQVMGSPGVDQVIVGFTLENRGNTAAENFTCEIRRDTEDGELLFSTQIDRVNAGETSGSQFVWDVSAESADFKTLVLIVDSEDDVDELDEENNVIVRQVPVFADLIVERWSIEIEGLDAGAVVRNAGPKPSLPTVIQVIRDDVVIGETAIDGLLSGESVEVEIALSEEVNYGRVTFSVNPDQDQDEMTFENNTVERIILVSGDLTGDGQVGLADFLMLAQYWLQDEPSVDIAPPGGDGIINMLDFAYLAENWLPGPRLPFDNTLNISVVNGTVERLPDQSAYTHGQAVELHAVANEGYVFTGWSGDLTGTENPVTIVMDQDKTVTAMFEPEAVSTYTVTFDLGGGTRSGGGALSQTVAHGGSATAPTVAPPAGYEFSHWEGSYTNVTSSRTITAHYNVRTYTVAFQAGQYGSITGGDAVQTVIHGQGATAPTITAHVGWVFTGWDRAFNNVTSDMTVTAQYERKSYTVTFDLDGKGTRSGGGALNQTVEHGQAATAPTVAADEGWTFVGWDTAFGNVTSNLTVTAQYTAQTYTVTFDLDDKGSRTGGGALSQTVQHGDQASAPTVTADTGWIFTGWDKSFDTITGDLTVTAQYSEASQSYTLTITADNGQVTKRVNGVVTTATTFTSGTVLELTATPDSDYVFAGWSGDAEGTENPTMVILDGNKSISAIFRASRRSLR